MKVVIFGANGQLGRCFQDVQKNNRERNYRFYDRSQFDIADPASYLSLNPSEIDVIINCAAYTKVDQAESDREKAFEVNVTGPALLAEFARENNLTIIHFSTDYVYGPAHLPIRESHPIAPANYYGQTKWEGEEAVRSSGACHLIFRTSWLYSAYGHNFVRTMLRLSETKEEIKVVNDQVGSPTYAGNLAEAIDHILHSGLDTVSLPDGTYNLADKGEVSWYEFARMILKNKPVTLHPIPTESYPTTAARPAYSVLDLSLFENTFHWKIPDWTNGLNLCLDQMK